MIKLGYEIGTGKEIGINLSHLIVTGITQLSGKTTTLEALIKRSGLKAIIFKTKIGEKSFTEGTEVAPFFRDRSDYEFVKSLIEAYSKEKLFLEKGTLMRLCKGSSDLISIKKKVDEELSEGKLRGIKEEIHTRLQHYLDNLIPQIQYSSFSKTLNIYDGINIMNLERFTEEAQSLIIQSVAEEVLKTMKGVIIVIPEAWKFLPQKYNNPCKRIVESFIRQGATNQNYIWTDSQDMAGVDKIPLKQISTWILGYQAERNEVKHTLDQISLPKKLKPKEDEIMNLKKGQFFLSCYDGVFKVYVQPSWLDDETAIEISKGNKDINEVQPPSFLVQYSKKTEEIKTENKSFDDSGLRREIIDLRHDFFNKIQELQIFDQKIAEEVYKVKNMQPVINEEELISKLMQKIPIYNSKPSSVIDEESIITKVIAKMPKYIGNNVYEVAPLEKIKEDFLEEAKNKLFMDVNSLSSDEKKVLKYIETKDVDVSPSEIITKCLLLKIGGSNSVKVSNILKSILSIQVLERTSGGRYRKGLRKRIENLLLNHSATTQQVDLVYNHILMEILKNDK